jgi:two-component system nitrate/nitrite response regulator NarL
MGQGMHGGTVLIADDDEAIRALLATALDAEGCTVVAAERGDAVPPLARRFRPDAVILDVAMPGLSGYEVCHRLREEFGEGISIVLLSGFRTDGIDRVAGLLLGADDYVVKPFDPNELVARVRRLLERSRRPPEMERLTARELEVLTLLARGFAQDEIASRLVISPKTAATHLQHILEKLRVHSRAQAVAAAFRYGLLANET